MALNEQVDFPLVATIDLGSTASIWYWPESITASRIPSDWARRFSWQAWTSRKTSAEAMQRGLDCLRRFAQLINDSPPEAVRKATSTLQVARNRRRSSARSEILGHRVDVISGREEARLTIGCGAYPGR